MTGHAAGAATVVEVELVEVLELVDGGTVLPDVVLPGLVDVVGLEVVVLEVVEGGAVVDVLDELVDDELVGVLVLVVVCDVVESGAVVEADASAVDDVESETVVSGVEVVVSGGGGGGRTSAAGKNPMR